MAHALINAVAVLIIACPCALVSRPNVHHGRDGKGATLGVLFRNAEAIEIMRKVDTLVVDKTGTLTRASRSLCPSTRLGLQEEPASPRRDPRAGSEHPLAAASSRAEDRGVQLEMSRLREHHRKACAAAWTAVPCPRQSRVDDPSRYRTWRLAQQAETCAPKDRRHVRRVDGKSVGLIGVADRSRTAPRGDPRVHLEGIRVVMLTGDSGPRPCGGGKLEIDDVIAEVLPDRR